MLTNTHFYYVCFMQDVEDVFLPCCAICSCLLWQINDFTGIYGVSEIHENVRLFSFAVTHMQLGTFQVYKNEISILTVIYYNRGRICTCKFVILSHLFEPLCEKTSFTMCSPQRHRPNCTSRQSKQCQKCKLIG